MTPVLLLSALLAAPDAGPSTRPAAPAAARAPDAGPPVRAADAGTTRADAPRPAKDAGQGPRGGASQPASQATAVDGAPDPSTRVSVQEPAAPDAGTPRRKKARADRTDGQPDPTTEALLEQSRAQTEALQQLAAQQRSYEEARIAEQQARSQREAQLDDARYSLGGTIQSLQATGDWNPGSLESTRASLQQTAAAASAAGNAAQASRAAEAARLVEAAQAALAQKNAQQAQYYLLQANQLLVGAQGGQGSRY